MFKIEIGSLPGVGENGEDTFASISYGPDTERTIHLTVRFKAENHETVASALAVLAKAIGAKFELDSIASGDSIINIPTRVTLS